MSHFHFTIGPVQGFVSQARRTRDFWAGSYLLSYLSAHAMKAVKTQGGKIIMPDVSSDKMLKRILDGSGDGPKIGTLPNCFEASVSDGFDGNAVVKVVQDEWERITEAVWEHDKLKDAGVNKTLWDEQIKGFWDIAWVIAPSTELAALAMRKNWRNHFPPEQAGDKCTMMGEWQELSGEPAPHPKKQREFWNKLRKGIGGSMLELRDGERLCAIAYVKRRFAYAWQFIPEHRGWELPAGVPSTSYMAAVHWLEQAIKHAPSDEVKKFHDAAQKLVEYGEWKTSITCIDKVTEDKKYAFKFFSLDGRVFFRSELENNKEFDTNKAKDALNALSRLSETKIAGRKLGYPTPFYAILLMDGDNLGAAIAAGNAEEVGKALKAFTDKVPDIVKEKNGFLVYAGGDDVLALLPLEDALSCADGLRMAYTDVFSGCGLSEYTASNGEKKKTSISAAIIYAHMKLPLIAVLKDSHRLLDDVAKEKIGRDAIAVRVWKPGGIQLTWAMKWDDAGGAAQQIDKLAQQFRQSEEGEPGHASKPLYRIRERLEMLKGGKGFTENEIKKLLVAEYATSGVLSKEDKEKKIPENRIAALLPLCKKPDNTFGAEGAMLLRFLAQKGVER